MIFQPTNIIPDELNGNGTVDLTEGLQVSWQINGDSPMTGYAVTIENYSDSSQNSLTVENSISAFWGRDNNGNVQRYYVNIPAAILSDYGISNGNDYALSITQFWTDSNSEKQEVKQLASSIFHARKNPVVSITTIPTVTTTDYTFQATYTQAQGDEINGIRWMLAQRDFEDKPLKDTGMIYGTGILKMYYNGLLNDTYYVVRCIVTTEYGAEADTGWVQFRVNYSVGEASNSVSACQFRRQNGILVSWNRTQSATRYLLFRKKLNATRLEHVAEIKSTAQGYEIVDYRAKSGEIYQYYLFPANATKYLTAAVVSPEIRVAYRYWAILEAVKYRENVYAVIHAHYFRYGDGGVKEGKISNNNSPNLLQNFTRYPTRQGNSQIYKTGTVTGYVGTIDAQTLEYSDTVEQVDTIMELSRTNNTLFMSDPKGHFMQIHIKDAISSQTSITKKIMPQTITVPWVEVGDAEDISLISMMSTTFTISYSANGGSGAPSGASVTDDKPTHTFTISTSVPTISGYTFDRWNTELNGSGKSYLPGSQITLKADEPSITLYAQWVSNTTYTFTLQYDERVTLGTETLGELVVVRANTHGTSYQFTVKSTEPETAQFYPTSFLGWSLTSGATTPTYVGGDKITLNTSNSTRTLYPVYANDLVEIVIYELQYFANATGVSGMPTSITLDSDTGSCDMGNVSYNIPTRDGYTFIGWNTSPYGFGVSYPAGEHIILYEDNPALSLYAIWSQSNQYYLYFAPNAGEDSVSGMPGSINNQTGEFSIPNTTPTRTGYTFRGWADSSTAVDPQYVYPDTVVMDSGKRSKTLYAVWLNTTTTNTFTLTYNVNGGTRAPAGVTKYGSESSIIEQVSTDVKGPLRTNYTFLGWDTDSTKTSNPTYVGHNGGNITLYANTPVTLYAIWESGGTKYRVNFNPNGTSVTNMPSPNPQESLNTKTFNLSSTVPVRNGFTFMGWSDSSSGSARWQAGGSFNLVDLVGNYATEGTVYAVWQAASVQNTFVLRMYSNEGKYTTTNDYLEHDYGNSSAQSRTVTIYDGVRPTRTGYSLAGWSDTSNGSVQYVVGGNVTIQANVLRKIYAVWTQSGYVLSFDGNPGGYTVQNVPADQTSLTESLTITTQRPSIVPEGYTYYDFYKWYDNANLTGRSFNPGDTYTFENGATNATLYAGWTHRAYWLSYDKNAGSDTVTNMPSGSSNYTGQFSLQNVTPVRQSGNVNYQFVGWGYTDDATEEEVINYPGVASATPGVFALTLYAVWEAPRVTYVLTYNPGDGWSGPSMDYAITSEIQHTFKISDDIPASQVSTTRDKLFLGWDTDPYGNGTRYVPGDEIVLANDSPEIELYAIYGDIQYYTYTLHFLPNAGSDTVINMPAAIPQLNPFSGSSYTFTIPSGTSNTPVRYGYAADAFDGWGETAAEDQSVIPKQPGDTITVYHNTVYSQFGPVWQSGAIYTSNGTDDNRSSSANNYIRTRGYIEFLGTGYRDAVTVVTTSATTRLFDYIVTESGGVKSYTFSSVTTLSGTHTFAPQSGHAYRFSVYDSNGVMTPTSANTYCKICDHRNMLLYAWWNWDEIDPFDPEEIIIPDG